MSSVNWNQGNIPVIISVPHGGDLCLPCVEPRTKGTSEPDFHTVELAATIQDELAKYEVVHEASAGYVLAAKSCASSGAFVRPFAVVGRVHRRYCDLNRPIDSAVENELARLYYQEYHCCIEKSLAIAKSWGCTRTLLVDLHGQSAMPQHILRGTRNYRTLSNLISLHGHAAVSGDESICGHLHKHGFPVFPAVDAPTDTPEHPEYNGGWTVHHYGAEGVGGADALQLEVGREHRRSAEARQQFAAALARAIVVYANRFVLPSLPKNAPLPH